MVKILKFIILVTAGNQLSKINSPYLTPVKLPKKQGRENDSTLSAIKSYSYINYLQVPGTIPRENKRMDKLIFLENNLLMLVTLLSCVCVTVYKKKVEQYLRMRKLISLCARRSTATSRARKIISLAFLIDPRAGHMATTSISQEQSSEQAPKSRKSSDGTSATNG